MGKIVSSHVTINVEFKITVSNSPKTVAQNIDTPNNQNELSKLRTKNIPGITDNGKVENSPTVNSIIKLKSGTRQIAEVRCDDADVCPYPAQGILSINKYLEIPFIAKRLKLTGEIIIEANIDKYGIMKDTKIIQGIGYGCDEAVESALMKIKFTPAQKGGKEVDSKVIIYFPFSYLE